MSEEMKTEGMFNYDYELMLLYIETSYLFLIVKIKCEHLWFVRISQVWEINNYQ